MNKLERIVYDLVKSNPWVKNSVRNVYQKVFDLMPKRKDFFSGEIDVKKGYFFGFHDISAFSDDESKVLANKQKIFLTMPKPEDSLEVGYFNIEDGKMLEYVSCTVSKAWNHHKGCRLQWLSDTEFIFNNYISAKLGSTIFNIETQESKNIGFPIDAVYRQERIATSFSYERLEELMPGYGYPYSDESYLKEKASINTGLFLVDLKKDSRRLLVSLRALAEEIGEKELLEYRHY